MQAQRIQLTGLTCGACVKLVERRLQRLPDVVETKVALDGAVEVVARREILPAEVQQVLADTPYNLAS